MIQIHETRQRFLDGNLHPVNILVCPDQCITNLPVPKTHSATVSGAALMIGDLVTGRSAENIGVGVGVSIPSELMDNPGQFQSVSDMLRWRFQNHPDSLLLSLIHISEPTRQAEISYAVFCLKKKKKKT